MNRGYNFKNHKIGLKSLKAYSVVVDDVVGLATVQHLPVPFHESLWFGNLLLHGVAVEDVVISLTRRTGPDVGRHEPGHRQREGGAAVSAVYVSMTMGQINLTIYQTDTRL